MRIAQHLDPESPPSAPAFVRVHARPRRASRPTFQRSRTLARRPTIEHVRRESP